MRVLNKFLLVKRQQENKMSTTGFMYGADDMKEIRYQKGTVISFGQNVAGIEENSEILFDKVAGHDVLIDKSQVTSQELLDVLNAMGDEADSFAKGIQKAQVPAFMHRHCCSQ